MTQAEFNELFDRLQRVGFGGDPTFRTRLMRRLEKTNYLPSDPCFRRLTDAQFIAHIGPLADIVGLEMTKADARLDI